MKPGEMPALLRLSRRPSGLEADALTACPCEAFARGSRSCYYLDESGRRDTMGRKDKGGKKIKKPKQEKIKKGPSVK
jgi:hypothetical protein